MQGHIQFRLNKHLQDFDPVLVGRAVCEPGYDTITVPQSYTLLHYIVKGKGTVQIGDTIYPVHAGQAFLCRPGEPSRRLISSEDDPWTLHWLGFSGSLSHSFSDLPPVFDIPEGHLAHLAAFRENSDAIAYQLVADLFLLHSTFQENKSKHKNYSQYVMDYIHATYSQKISVEAIAAQLGLDRRYLSQQFKKHTNYTIQGYILNVRITEAKNHLLQGYSIKETAHLCGFNDTANFSKLFAREEGQSPRDWRNTILSVISDFQKNKQP